MPAWGLSHDDDVIWSMVAFLQKLPTLNAEQYAAMTSGESSHHHEHEHEESANTAQPDKGADTHGRNRTGRSRRAVPAGAGEG